MVQMGDELDAISLQRGVLPPMRRGRSVPTNPSDRISQYIDELADWRGKVVARLRKLILDAAPGIIEEWKWNTPVWSRRKNIIAAGAFQDHVKVNFFQGAKLDNPHGLFNAGVEAKTSRSIDIRNGDAIHEAELRKLIRAADLFDSAKPKSKTSKARKK